MTGGFFAFLLLCATLTTACRSKRPTLGVASSRPTPEPHFIVRDPAVARGVVRPTARTACSVEISGAKERSITGIFRPASLGAPAGDVGASSDYWASEEDLWRVLYARSLVFSTEAAARLEVARRMQANPRSVVLELSCLTDDGGVVLLTGDRTRYENVDFGPGDYGIGAGDMATAPPGELVAQTVRVGRLEYFKASSGRLHVTRFDRSGVAGSFTLTAEAADGGSTIRATGTFDFPCDPLQGSRCVVAPQPSPSRGSAAVPDAPTPGAR